MLEQSARDKLLELSEAIESEMKRLGIWSDAAASLPDKPKGAFGSFTSPFEVWLQYVLIPKLRDAAHGGAVPDNSNVAVVAVSNLDGFAGTERLIELLAALDATIDAPRSVFE